MDSTITPTPHFRKLWPSERLLYQDHLLLLGPKTRILRFGGDVPDAAILSLSERTTGLNSVIHAAFVGDKVRGVGEFRPLSRTWPLTAEVALSVEDDWQGRGLGTALMGRITTTARNRGIRRLVMQCLANNTRMRRLARRFEGQLEILPGGVECQIGSPVADPYSLFGEWLDDAFSMQRFVLDL